MPFEIGSRLGPYEIVARLGEGGMGEVYRACDTRLSRDVAIKRLRAEAEDETRQRFWREARAAAAISHPNVCAIYDVGDAEGEPWLAMELLEGENLEDRLRRGPLPADEAVARLLEVLAGLEALHARGIIHRDLKPSNVHLTPHGAKLLDFGLALPTRGPLGDETRLTRADLVIGTPQYMAPEQWRGEPLSPATDLFACGALLYEALSGTSAFRGDTPIAVYESVMRDQPPALVGDAGIEALDRVIQKAIAKRPLDRFGSAREMADALAAASRGAGDLGSLSVSQVLRLVVVPFRLLRPDAEIDFLAPALAEAISGSLRELDHVAVRSPRLIGEPGSHDLAAVARLAQVDVALVGSLLRAGSRVRATAELVAVPGGAVRWSGTAEAKTDDLFALVDELARQVVDALQLPLAAPAATGSGAIPKDRAAYELYLRASEIGRDTSRTPSLTLARDLLVDCVTRDPGFAPAWAQLGRVYRVLGKFGHADRDDCYRLARQAFERALALQPELPLTQNLYTHFEIENLANPVPAMLRLLGRIEKRRTDAELYAGLVIACRYCGLLDASVAAHDRARRLDPAVRTSVHFTYWLLGDYQRALENDDEPAAFIRNYSLPMLDRTDEAITGYRSWLELAEDGFERILAESSIGALCGDRNAVISGSQRMIDSGFADPEGLYFVVRNFAKIGELDRSLDLLERIVRSGFTIPITLESDAWLAPLRETPRFAELLGEAAAANRHAAELFERAGGPRLLGVAEPTRNLSGGATRP